MSTPVLLPRSAWTTHGPVDPLSRLSQADVKGVAVHWPGTTAAIGDTGLSGTARRLEGYRRFHTAAPPVGRGWSDIAYSVAIDQGGRVFSLRGIEHRSAANGTSALNGQWLAVLLLVGPGEQPSKAMLDSFRWLRSRVILKRYPAAKRVVGHGQIRPAGTDCPGPLVMAHIRSGDLAKAWQAPVITPPKRFVLRRFLVEGTTGPDVEAWQRRINADFPADEDIRVDGDFGSKTARASEVWQDRHGLVTDAVVGRQTATAAGWDWAGPR